MSDNLSKKNLKTKKSATIIGSGIGGLSLAIRLQAMGFQTTVLEKLDKAGGRAYQKSVVVDGIGEFKFDMGPTVLTVPHFIEELFALKPGDKTSTREQDYPSQAWDAIDLQEGLSREVGESSEKLKVKSEKLENYLEDLVKIILQKSKEKDSLVVAIDGIGGSGKSYLANLLKEKIPASVLIEREKFMKFMEKMDTKSDHWQHQNFEINEANFQAEINKNQGRGVVIIEGIKTFEIEADIKIWMETEVEIADDRAKKRDLKEEVNPIGFEKFWQDYKVFCDEYIKLSNPKDQADIVFFDSSKFKVESSKSVDFAGGLEGADFRGNPPLTPQGGNGVGAIQEGNGFQASPTFASTNHTQNYVKIVPITPFYRIYFADKTYFDYDGDLENTMKQIKNLTGLDSEVEGFKQFQKDALQVFKRGFMELGYTHFTNPWDMIKIIPDLMKLDVIRGLFGYISKYFKHEKTQQIFSFEPLLVGGNPNNVPALYVMIHFVEKTWRVHYAMGGTGALIQGFVKKLEELGGQIKLNSEVQKILIEDNKAVGVRLKNGEEIKSDIVCSNADYAHTYETLVQKPKLFNNKLKTEFLTTYSMSLFVIYFAFKIDPKHPLNLRHHNIILGGDYQPELEAIFKTGKLHPKFSQYLHIPTYTDKSMAPEGYHTAYTLVCVPNKKTGKHNWANQSEEFMNKILSFIEEKGYIPELSKRLVHKSYINPDYFETSLNSKFGNAFGVSPILRQSAFFRPQNKSRDLKNLYCVGANYQPGAGTPSVMMSAKMVARLVESNE